MYANISLAANVGHVDCRINARTCANLNILKILKACLQIPLHQIVEPLSVQRHILIGIQAAVIAWDAHKPNRLEMFGKLRDKLRNQFAHTNNLLNNIFFVTDSNTVVNVPADLIAVAPDDAVLRARLIANGDNARQVFFHHLPADFRVVCMPVVIDHCAVMNIIQTDQQITSAV